MATASQTIEQPTLPPARDADSLAGVEPATSAAEIISQQTPRDSCGLGSLEPSLPDPLELMQEFEALDKQAYAKADELTGEYQKVMKRFNDELLPLCDRVQAFLSQRGSMHLPGLPSWTAWRDRFIEYLQKNMKMSLSTFKRRLKEFQVVDEVDEPTPDEPEGEGEEPETEPDILDSPKTQITKWIARQRKSLTGGDGPMDADPVRDGERRVDTSLQQLDELKLAIDEGLLDTAPLEIAPVAGTTSAKPQVNKRLWDMLKAGKKYIRTMERVLNAVALTDQQKEDIEKAASRWREVRTSSKLKAVPLHLREANELVARLHRHHKPIRIAKFSIGCEKDGELVGVAICMRPACRALDDGKTIEVCRLATDGTDNACSLLYSACAKTARDMGYAKITTYILESEPGTSLKAAGWTLEKTGCGGTPQGKRTNRPNGHEITPVTFMKKQRWAKMLQPEANMKAASSVPVEDADDEADVA